MRTLSGVSPCGTCQTISPRSRLIAEIVPYGGLRIGRPSTVSPPRAGRRRRRWPAARRRRRGRGGCAAAALRLRARRIGRAAVARPEHFAGTAARRCPRRSGCPRTPAAAATSDRRRDADVVRAARRRCASRIVGDARPVGAADGVAHVDRAEHAVDVAEHRRVEHRRRRPCSARCSSSACARSSGVKSIRSSGTLR